MKTATTGAGKINLYRFQQMISSESFKKYPCFTREDFFDYLLESNIERSLAFDASECIRKTRKVLLKVNLFIFLSIKRRYSHFYL